MNHLSLNKPTITYSPLISNPKLNPNKPYNIKTPSIDVVRKIGTAYDPKEIPSKMLLNLLKSGLTGKPVNEKFFVGRTYNDWVNMYNLSHQNAVMPTVFDGIKNNPKIKVPNDVLENMKINKDFAKNYHGYQERILKDLTEITAKNGIDTVQMKGIGFSMNYPNPTSRFGGDIDIFNYKHGTNPSDPKNNMSLIVDKITEKLGIETDTKHSKKHSHITYKNVPIENHRNFLDVECSPISKKMNNYLYKVIKPVEETLPHGTKILVPSKEFNTVFISFHAMQHYIGGGINFHHLADWAVHVNKHGLKVPEEAKGSKFEEFMYAFTNLANKHLGTNVKVPENKKLEDEIFNKMLHPEKTKGGILKPNTKNPIKILTYKYKNIAEGVIRRNEYWGTKESITKTVVKSFFAHLKKPKTILTAMFKV